MTPAAGTFPRFTSGPSLVTKYACSVVDGASNSRLSWPSPEASTSSTSPNRSAPSGRQIPDRPLSLAYSVTSDAPAARSSAMYSAQILGGSCSDRPGSL